MFFKWKPSKVFFGWWIVAAAFIVALYTGGAIFYGFTAIFEPIANEFGWSYTQISLAASLRGFEISFLAPLAGIFVDRWGPRRLILTGIVITSTGLILLSQINSLTLFYSAFFIITLGISCCSMTVLMTTITKWFRRKVGLASGIAVSGFGAGGLLIPAIVKLIELYDWRMTMVIFAIGMLIIVMPLSILFRHKPEQYGYLQDGQYKSQSNSENGLAEGKRVEFNIRITQALKSIQFWLLVLTFGYVLMVVSALATHIMPYLNSINIDRSKSSFIAATVPVLSIGGRLILGWLGDKFNRRLVLATAFAMMGLGLLCFEYISIAGLWLVVPFLLLFSTGYGGCVAIRPSLTRDYFGTLNFGTIFGFIIGFNALGGIVGPPLAGWIFDISNSYQNIWVIFAGLSIIPVISVLAISLTKVDTK